MSEPEAPPTEGFRMSGRRTFTELAIVVALIAGALAGILWIARHSADLLADHVPPQVDRVFGEQASKALAATAPRCSNAAALEYVENIARPLIANLESSPFVFQFSVADDPEVNAFALPGGFVTVNRGLLEAANSGEEVAAVLAHELQHVLRRHGTRRLLGELGTTTVLYAVFGGTDIFIPAAAAYDLARSAYGRDQEREADGAGLELLVKAGIDPSGMARFFERLAKTGPRVPLLLSTHPDPGDRAATAIARAKTAAVKKTLPSPKGVRCR